MRLARIAMLFALILFGITAVAQAQIAHTTANTGCGCDQCAQVQHDGCCPPLLPTIKAGLHSVFSALLPCGGCDARRKIYRKALYRNAFDKCCGLHFLPFYSRRFCGGPGSGGCQHCGPGGYGGEEILNMNEFPDDGAVGPTPAAEPPAETDAVPTTPPKAARLRQWHGRAASTRTPHRSARARAPRRAARAGERQQADRVADARSSRRGPSAPPRRFAPVVAKKLLPAPATILPVTAVKKDYPGTHGNPLR